MKETKELATKKDLKEVEEKLSKKIDRNSEKIDSLSKSLDSVATQAAKNTERLEKTATKEDLNRVAIQVVKNSEAISKMVTKEEFNQKFSELSAGQEKMMTILQRLDQERIFTTEWVTRIEKQVERNKEEIEKIKVKLAIS